MVAPRRRACSYSSSTTMPEPSPSTKPSRCRSNGRDAFWGASLRVDRAVSRLNPVTPNGWIMLWAPPESIRSASPWRISSVASPTAWLLAAQAVRRVKLGPRRAKVAARGGGRVVRLLLGLAAGVEALQPAAGEGRLVDGPGLRAVRLGHQPGQVVEVLHPLARAEVGAEPVAVHLGPAGQQARVIQRLLGRGGGEPGVDPGVLPARRVLDEPPQVEVADLGGERGGEAAGGEAVERAHA